MKDFIDHGTDFTVKNLEIRNNTFNGINTDSGSKFEVEINYDEKSVSVEIIDCAIISNEQYQILLAAESERDELKSKISEPVDITKLMDFTIIDNVFDVFPQDNETMFFIDFGLGEQKRRPYFTMKNIAVIAKARYVELQATESKLAEIEAQEHIGEIVVDTERGYQFVGGDLIDDLIDGRHKVYIQPKPAEPVQASEPLYLRKLENGCLTISYKEAADMGPYYLHSQVTPNKAEVPSDEVIYHALDYIYCGIATNYSDPEKRKELLRKYSDPIANYFEHIKPLSPLKGDDKC